MRVWQLRKLQQMRPIGGHHFSEDGQTFRGDTLDEVVKALSDYRINNSAPLGDPEQDVLRYYAEHWPYMVDIVEDPPEPETPSLRMTRWMQWVRKQWGKPAPKMATQQEAAIRWEVCLGCPHNVKLYPSTREQMEIERKAFLLRAGQNVPEKLGFCSLHRHDTTVAVFTEAPAAGSEKPKDLPNHPGCWVA